MSVGPPQSLHVVIDGESVRPAHLTRYEGQRQVRAVQTQLTDVRLRAPVGPVHVSARYTTSNFIIMSVFETRHKRYLSGIPTFSVLQKK